MSTEEKLPRKYRYYEALGVDKKSSFEDIKKSYRSLVKKFHPDINNDPKASEILKKINEAYNILSKPSTRLLYDNSEAECPKCWTHEVTRIVGEKFTTYQWRCRHCGYNFQFLKKVKDDSFTETEKKASYRRFICPQCKKELEFDQLILLYRCKNKKCLRVFTYKELCKYYKIRMDAAETHPEKQNSSVYKGKSKNEKDPLSPIVFITFIGSILANGFIIYTMIYSFSGLFLGIFLLLTSFSLLSYWVYKHPTIIRTIRALIVKK